MAKVSVFDNNYFKKFYAAYLVGGAAGAARFIRTKSNNYDIEEYKDAITFIRDDFTQRIEKFSSEENYDELIKSIFESLCERDYDEALVMLGEQLTFYKFKSTFNNHLEFFVKKTIETKRNENNTRDLSKVKIEKSLMQETLPETTSGKAYSAFIKNYMPDKFISSFNRYKELSMLDIEDINTVYHPLDKYTDPKYLMNYFRLLKEKDINLFIDELSKLIESYATGERNYILNLTLSNVFDADMDSEKRKELKTRLKDNDLLSKLTRGELQNFILEGDVCAETKILLIESSLIDLFKDNGEEDALYANKTLYNLYRDYYLFYLNEDSLFIERKDMGESFGMSEDDVKEATFKIHKYEKLNLLKILACESKPQKMKWLQEAYPTIEAKKVKYFSDFDDFKDLPIYYYRQFIDEVIKEFYDEKGIDYNKVNETNNIPRNISYGIEIEEIGLESDSKYANINYFESKYDASLSYYGKGKGNKALSYVTTVSNGEYVSDTKQTLEDYKYELDYIMDEIDLLNFFGAKINGTCGFHVHLSSSYTENAEDKDMIGIYGMPDEYSPDDFLDSPLKKEYEERKDDEGFLVPQRIAKEMYEMQSVLESKLKIHDNRSRNKGHASRLKSKIASFSDRSKFVNFVSLENGKGIEFRFFNLPDCIDKKVVEAYIEFATSYFAYLEEGNNTLEYATEAYNDATGLDIKDLSVEEYENYMYDILLSQLDLNDDTILVLKNLDDIFELYNTQEYSISPKFDYYTPYDMNIEDEELYSFINNETLNEQEEIQL